MAKFIVLHSSNTRDSGFFGIGNEIFSLKDAQKGLYEYKRTMPGDSYQDGRLYNLAGMLDAEDFEDAYAKSQNMEDHWNTASPCRSTMVGDILYRLTDDYDYDEAQIVSGFGFTKL